MCACEQSAVNNLQRKYEISRDLLQSGQGTMQQFTDAQIYLGIARGNAMITQLIAAVNQDLPNLLEWKITHNETKIGVKR
jgi:hypothetical protein